MPTLIFNADDYGLSPAVSRGILTADRGVVRSTTVMANFVTDDEARALIDSGMGCGAHLNISSGVPLTDYPAALRKVDGVAHPERQSPASSDAESQLGEA